MAEMSRNKWGYPHVHDANFDHQFLEESQMTPAQKIFALDEHIAERKQEIMANNETMKQIRAMAETRLGFKCSVQNIKSCMTRHEIPVRRSKADAEKQMMIEQIQLLEDLLIDVVSYGNLPPRILSQIQDRRGSLNQRVLDAISRRLPA